MGTSQQTMHHPFSKVAASLGHSTRATMWAIPDRGEGLSRGVAVRAAPTASPSLWPATAAFRHRSRAHPRAQRGGHPFCPPKRLSVSHGCGLCRQEGARLGKCQRKRKKHSGHAQVHAEALRSAAQCRLPSYSEVSFRPRSRVPVVGEVLCRRALSWYRPCQVRLVKRMPAS